MPEDTIVRLSPLENIINVSWQQPLWVLAVNVRGPDVPFANSCTCTCPAMPGTGITRYYGPDGEFTIFANGGNVHYTTFADSYNLDVEMGLVYLSTDGLKWKLSKIPNVDWGIDRVYGINGELIVTGVPGGRTPLTCTITCLILDSPTGEHESHSCPASGEVVPNSASAASSIDRGKTWKPIFSGINYNGVIVSDEGKAAGDRGGEKILVKTYSDVENEYVEFNLVTPWPAGTRRDFTFDGAGGVGNNSTAVRHSTDDGVLTVETSTDGGKTFKTTLTLVSVPGYMHVRTLGYIGPPDYVPED